MDSLPPMLTDAEVDTALADLHEDWTVEDHRLRRHLSFTNFAQAFGFMTEIAIICERANHHPEWSNVYNRVTIELTTHDAGGITRYDIELASAVDRAARKPEPA